jgi:hypothetical protein
MTAEIAPNISAGIQTEICGGRVPASAKVRNIMKKRIKMKDNRNPNAI